MIDHDLLHSSSANSQQAKLTGRLRLLDDIATEKIEDPRDHGYKNVAPVAGEEGDRDL